MLRHGNDLGIYIMYRCIYLCVLQTNRNFINSINTKYLCRHCRYKNGTDLVPDLKRTIVYDRGDGFRDNVNIEWEMQWQGKRQRWEDFLDKVVKPRPGRTIHTTGIAVCLCDNLECSWAIATEEWKSLRAMKRSLGFILMTLGGRRGEGSVSIKKEGQMITFELEKDVLGWYVESRG